MSINTNLNALSQSLMNKTFLKLHNENKDAFNALFMRSLNSSQKFSEDTIEDLNDRGICDQTGKVSQNTLDLFRVFHKTHLTLLTPQLKNPTHAKNLDAYLTDAKNPKEYLNDVAKDSTK